MQQQTSETSIVQYGELKWPSAGSWKLEVGKCRKKEPTKIGRLLTVVITTIGIVDV